MFEIRGLSHPMHGIRVRQVTAENVHGKAHSAAQAWFRAEESLVESRRMGQPDSLAEPSHPFGQGFKVRPCLQMTAHSLVTLLDYDGPAVIRHFWCTTRVEALPQLVLRFYWDGAVTPAIEVPLGHFFCNAGAAYEGAVHSILVNVNPNHGLNCFIPMPFRKHGRCTLENLSDSPLAFYYSFSLTEEAVPEEEYYLHAYYHHEERTNPKEGYTILPKVVGCGRYLGTYLTWHQQSDGWWGEGEVKMFLDGDGAFPTLCGTGTEDYFGGAWNFKRPFTAPFLGCPHLEEEKAGSRHAMYRFHVPDPILFERELRVTCQCLGWGSDESYRALEDEVSSLAYWYQK